MLILALLEQQQRHGYEIGQLIAERSDGVITFHIASLHPTLYRLDKKGLIEGPRRRAEGTWRGPAWRYCCVADTEWEAANGWKNLAAACRPIAKVRPATGSTASRF